MIIVTIARSHDNCQNRSHDNCYLNEIIILVSFHKLSSGRKRKNTISYLEKDENLIEGDKNLLTHATGYYTKLFGPTRGFNIQMNANIMDEIEQSSESDNEDLCRPFSESEIKAALFQREKNKVVILDSIPISYTS